MANYKTKAPSGYGPTISIRNKNDGLMKWFPIFLLQFGYMYIEIESEREREREREGEREREIHIYLYIVYDLSNSYLVTCRFPLCKQVALLQLAAASRSFGPAWPGRSDLGADLGWNLGKG